jgi:hypothetical protein
MDRQGRTGFTMIKAAQRAHERHVLREIRNAVRAGTVWSPRGPSSLALWSAVARLEAKGRITRRRRRKGYVLAA